MFKRVEDRLITYRSTRVRSVVDYVMVKPKYRKFIKNVKTMPGELQHSMVVMDVESKEMVRRHEAFVSRRRTWLLRDESVRREFEAKLLELWNHSSQEVDAHHIQHYCKQKW